MERFSQKDGMMVKTRNGGWIRYSDVKGTEQEIKEWMRKYAVHANYPICQIRKTKECTCGLNEFIYKTI